MAVQETNHHDATLRIACALPLVDFDWKLKYTVASATIAAVNKPLLRLELYVSKASSKVEDVGLGTTIYPENQIQPLVAEFSKAQLDALLETMDAIEQGLAGVDSPIDAVRFAIIAGTWRKRLWSFGTSERKWYAIPFEFLPIPCDSPVAGDGGLLCCRRPALPSKSNQVKQDLQLYVCNPLTQAWRKLPLPSLVQEFDLVHLVTDRRTKQYTITVVNDLQQGRQHSWNTKAVVEVYNSSTNMWTASNGIFQSTGTNLIYYKKYIPHEFVGIRAYDKTTGYTSIPFNVPEDIFFSEGRGFHPLTEYQGQIYMLQTEAATSGIWVLRGPSHEWEKICSVPQPSEVLKLYLFSLYVSADVIIIFGDYFAVADSKEPENCVWMLDRAQGKWIDVFYRAQEKWIDVMEYEWDSTSFSQFMFEIRLDGIP